MEAGNRCYDDRVPEEVNRRIIDHCSDILMPYTERSRMNLIHEGITNSRIYVTGNPIFEVILRYQQVIDQSSILKKLSLKKNGYILVTVHRAENVDVQGRLESILRGLEILNHKYKIPIIISLHPHTKDRLSKYGIATDGKDLQFHTPFGFIDFIALEQNARCVISDSGTVQEECCIFHVPTVTIRDVTERPETLEFGSNMLSGSNEKSLETCAEVVLQQESHWYIPEEYTRKNVSDTVIKLLLGYYHNL
jgi:UDP-N-acetylglucosamine 2-epimerase (non-hydrolysing)